MPIIRIDINTDDFLYEFDRRKRQEEDAYDVEITEEEYQQLQVWQEQFEQYQKFLHEKHKMAESCTVAFNNLHKSTEGSANENKAADEWADVIKNIMEEKQKGKDYPWWEPKSYRKTLKKFNK